MLNTKEIGNRIAEARKRLKVSQAELAQRLFISPQAVGKWERGESMPDIVNFNRLAEILGVDLNYFSEKIQPVASETWIDKEEDKRAANSTSVIQNEKLNWNMSQGNWVDADFSGLKNLHEKFNASNMQRCKFVGSELSGLLLKGNHVDTCDFSDSDLSRSNIQSSHLVKNAFKSCLLKETELSGSHIKGCDFSTADFTGARFKASSCQNNKMRDAVLNHTSFIATDINDIVFDGKIDDCYFENCSFKKVTFQNVILTNTFFKNKNLKGIRFVDCQADRMTYEFLKNGKANLTGITLLTP